MGAVKLVGGDQVTFWQHYCGEEGDVCNLYLSGSSKMMLVLTSLVNSTMAWTAERNSRARFLAARSVQLTRQRIDAIASTLMPPMVVEEMRSLPFDAPLPSHKYQRATIAQSDLCGFTKLASTRMPQEVVQFIGDLFHLFDDLTDKHQVYKVETVGDAYIAGQADLPLTQKNHPVSVVLFGLEMVRAVHSWAGAHGFVDGQGCSVSCRVGIAHGACIGGIVGTEMQRYHLFGELMSELEVLESTAPQGLVQASTACKNVAEEIMRVEKIPSQLLSFEQRDLPYLQTSKGDVVPLEKAKYKSRGFVAESYAVSNGKVQQAGSALPRRAEPTEAERKAAREMLKGSPVGEMGTSIGQDGASTLYTVVGGLFLFMLLLTAAVVSGAIG
ncbi:GUCY2C [Symbiodinium necroappetens]|uniref:GUCY2C protein n=1 Tax=Symbiodinium necroappetens TaxID=1628268 RepID=A0A812WG21_9DINO|nr:GUCY2C [Symbiodinium necroappetens]